MKNEQKIIQNFIGEINGVKITHEPTYWETGNVLDRFAEKFDDAEVTKEFTINHKESPWLQSRGWICQRKLKKSLTKSSNWCIIYSKVWHCR